MTTVTERRSCRCCGRSIMFDEREYMDEFKPGIDVCPDCMLHFQKRSCMEDSNGNS